MQKRRGFIASICLITVLKVDAQPPTPPYPDPARPAPFWTWDTIPLAYHGANTTGLFSAEAVAQLSKYRMVTIEKWYTPCGQPGPGGSQSNSSCDVEAKMFQTFHDLKAINPNITNIIYLNSMMDFDFYHLNGVIQNLESSGQHRLLRDMNGALVELCNDGDVYCNVTFFDHSLEAMRELWVEAVLNATTSGGVDGVFADHASQMLTPGLDGIATLCNGSPQRCYNFTNEFAALFNEGHAWVVNKTQDMISRLPGSGPIMDGPYARYIGVPACDYSILRPIVEEGLAGGAPYVLEATRGGCDPDESCLANFLAAAEAYTYLGCMPGHVPGGGVPAFLPEYAYPLGPPTGPPVEAGGFAVRHFRGPAGTTTARVDLKSGVGTVQWAGRSPSPSPAASPSPAPASCHPEGDTAVAQHDVAVFQNSSVADCCAACVANSLCVLWCFHGESDHSCHLHSSAGVPHPLAGATSGAVNRTRGGTL